ncbi:UNVERIFIED_CONTAM: hypothetical protein FKN15_043924 [Acipenser sinensis]
MLLQISGFQGQKPGRPGSGAQTALAVTGQGPGCVQVGLTERPYLPWPYFWARSGGDTATLPSRVGDISTAGCDAPFPCPSTGEDEVLMSAHDTDIDLDGSEPHFATWRPEELPSGFRGS